MVPIRVLVALFVAASSALCAIAGAAGAQTLPSIPKTRPRVDPVLEKRANQIREAVARIEFEARRRGAQSPECRSMRARLRRYSATMLGLVRQHKEAVLTGAPSKEVARLVDEMNRIRAEFTHLMDEYQKADCQPRLRQ